MRGSESVVLVTDRRENFRGKQTAIYSVRNEQERTQFCISI